MLPKLSSKEFYPAMGFFDNVIEPPKIRNHQSKSRPWRQLQTEAAFIIFPLLVPWGSTLCVRRKASHWRHKAKQGQQERTHLHSSLPESILKAPCPHPTQIRFGSVEIAAQSSSVVLCGLIYSRICGCSDWLELLQSLWESYGRPRFLTQWCLWMQTSIGSLRMWHLSQWKG